MRTETLKKPNIFSYAENIFFYTTVLMAVGAIFLTILPWYGAHSQNNSLKQAELGYQVEALHSAEKAVFFDPYSIQSLFVLAGAQQRLGREMEAKSTLMKATELQPLNYATWEQLATYERDRWHEPEKAQEHFQKSASLNPQDSQLRKEAGMSE